jgi:trk system potassium uptake protein TrkH
LSDVRGDILKRKTVFRTVTLIWGVLCIVGAVPFILSGTLNPIDALFESVSGFSTTGLTVIAKPEALSGWLLLWRSFTHWIGGMGVLALLLAIIPHISGHPSQLLLTEAPGPVKGKLVTKTRDSARIMYGLYFAITLILFILLIIGGMTPLDAICHTFGTVGTGGFSTKSSSIAYYNSTYIDIVITVFMILCSVNFNIYFLLAIRKFKDAVKSEELHWLLGIYAAAVAVIVFSLTPVYHSFGTALKNGAFHAATAMSTTGYVGAAFETWPHLAQAVLIALMFIGGSAGSTAGGFKISRILLLGKNIKRELARMLHPKQIAVIQLERTTLSESVIKQSALYLSCYITILFFSTLLVCFDKFNFETSFLTVLSAFNNIGLNWGVLGSGGNMSEFSVFSKLVLMADMLLGRLEIFPILLALNFSRK